MEFHKDWRNSQVEMDSHGNEAIVYCVLMTTKHLMVSFPCGSGLEWAGLRVEAGG